MTARRLAPMKRQRITEREQAEAEAKNRRHRDDLLADLQAREAARRGAPPEPEGPVAQTDEVPASDDEPHAPPAPPAA